MDDKDVLLFRFIWVVRGKKESVVSRRILTGDQASNP